MNNILQLTEIERFIYSGEYDNSFEIWSGGTFVDRAKSGYAALRGALIAEVSTLTDRVAVPEWHDPGWKINARAKFSPMVRGLFSQAEQTIILDMLEHSVVFLTPTTIITTLEKTKWLHTAWELANLYLASLDAKLLSVTAPGLLGLSEETTCYVSMKYFGNNDPFDDYVIHEAAHIFHNCKRETIGLPASRRREWLLEIDYAKRETFAYACEAYSRILELGETRLARIGLLSELAKAPNPPDKRVQGDEYIDILHEAVTARNGWKRILERCSPSK